MKLASSYRELRAMLPECTTSGQGQSGVGWESDPWSRLINSPYKKLCAPSSSPLRPPLSSPWLALECLLNKHLRSHQSCALVSFEHCECLQRNSTFRLTCNSFLCLSTLPHHLTAFSPLPFISSFTRIQLKKIWCLGMQLCHSCQSAFEAVWHISPETLWEATLYQQISKRWAQLPSHTHTAPRQRAKTAQMRQVEKSSPHLDEVITSVTRFLCADSS